MLAAISAPKPDVSGASWAMRSRPVFLTDCQNMTKKVKGIQLLTRQTSHLSNCLLIPRQNRDQVNQFTGNIQLIFGHLAYFMEDMNLCPPPNQGNIIT